MSDAYISILLNGMILIVMGIVGWLLKRAISTQDESIKSLVNKVDEANKSVNQLQLLIVGDYVPRKELANLTETFQHTTDQLRQSMHNLRDQIQAMISRISLVEARQRVKEKDE